MNEEVTNSSDDKLVNVAAIEQLGTELLSPMLSAINAVPDALGEMADNIDNVEDSMADAYDAESTYDEGDYCVYEGTLYCCNTDISLAESFNSNKWTAVQLTDLVSSGGVSGSGGVSSFDDLTDRPTKGVTSIASIISPLPTGGGSGGGGGSFLAQIKAPAYASEDVTLSDGGSNEFTGTFDSSGNANIVVTAPGTYTVTVGSNDDEIGEIEVGVYTLDASPTIYGFHMDMTKSDPAQIISYNVKYNGEFVKNRYYTPAKMNYLTDTFDMGDWNLKDDFFVPRSCMLKYDGTVDYYLDEDDETKKEDGTVSDVANTSYEGNAMMEWGRDGKRIYYKIVPDATNTDGATFYISDHRVDDGFIDYSFYDCDGNEIDHFYTPKYVGSLINSKLRSISGQAPMRNQTGVNEVTYANNNNVNGKVEWDTETWGDRTLINILLYMIGKSTNVQKTFGRGYVDASSSESSLRSSGTKNGKGMFYGTSSSDTVKVFGMEHYWGNQWSRIRGLLNMSGTIKYKMTYSQVDGTTQTGYDDTGSGYKTVANGIPGGTSRGYVSTAIFTPDGIYYKTMSGSESTYLCDAMWFNNGQNNYALVGGVCDDGARAGFCVYLSLAFGYSYWSLGARPSCKPLSATA